MAREGGLPLSSGEAAGEAAEIEKQLDNESLPLGSHFAALASSCESTQRAVRRRALLTALQHATPAMLDGYSGGSCGIFRWLAGLSPAQQFQPHLEALVDIVAQQSAPAGFLSVIYEEGLSSAEAASVQVSVRPWFPPLCMHFCALACPEICQE